MLDVILSSLNTLWFSFVGFLPTLLAALVVFIIGWLIAIALGKLANRIIKVIKLDLFLIKIGFKKALAKAKLKLDSGHFFEELVKWFFIIVFLMAAADILGLSQVTEFLKGILFYIPNIVVAVIVLLAAVIVANFLQKLVRASVEAAGLQAAGFLSGLTKWAVLIFGFIAALSHLGIAVTLLNTLVIGLVAMLALAGGLAFGLGGKEQAARFIDKLKKDLGEK